MSDPATKGLKRPSPRSAPRRDSSLANASSKSSAKNKTLSGSNKPTKIAPLPKRHSAAEKAPAHKAAKSKANGPTATASSGAHTSSSKISAAKSGKKLKKTAAATSARPAVGNSTKAGAKKTVVSDKRPASAAPKKSPPTPTPKATAKPTAKTVPTKVAPTRKSGAAPAGAAPRQPTRDEAAALRAFENAHREFTNRNFSAAKSAFIALIDQYAGVTEVIARARTYLNIAESRLRTDPDLPRDADSLYDRGVIELNRGEYVAAQEMFERALKREPEAAHIHYGLAAARARLGSIEPALVALERALSIQSSLRVRAQHDQDFTPLRNEPDFERLVFPQR